MAIVYTQADLDALKEALVTGASEVRVGDRTIRYRSQAELQHLIREITEQLDGVAASDSSANLIKPTYSKGRA